MILSKALRGTEEEDDVDVAEVVACVVVGPVCGRVVSLSFSSVEQSEVPNAPRTRRNALFLATREGEMRARVAMISSRGPSRDEEEDDDDGARGGDDVDRQIDIGGGIEGDPAGDDEDVDKD